MAKPKPKFTITIKDLPEGKELNEEELKKTVGGLFSLTRLSTTKLAAGDCDCWSHTACNCTLI